MYVFFFSIHLCCSPAHLTTNAETTNLEFLLICYQNRLIFKDKTLVKFQRRLILFVIHEI